MEKITSRKNPLCVHMRKLGESSRYRHECGEFLCDGIKLFGEAVRSSAEIKAVLTESVLPFRLPADTRVFFADRDVINSLSPLKNSQDILFSCGFPDFGEPAMQEGTRILLDGVQDPGNLGAIIRTANAFGISDIILTGGCADPYNPKTIRASMGAIFKQRIRNIDPVELVGLKEAGVRFIGAVSDESGRDFSEINLHEALIIIGSEGCGISDEILTLCDEKIRIPIAPECESLNAAVAAAIIIWEVSRLGQR